MVIDDNARTSQRGRISRATLTEQLEEALRVDILDGAYQPGERLRASDLTERYGVSATPLREALQRLAAENLVELDPRFGAAVSRISEHDLRDIYELLAMVGGMALERAVQRGDAAWDEAVGRCFDRLRAASRQLDEAAADDQRRRMASDAATAHWEFHDALYQSCGSQWLLRLVKMLHANAERYRRLSLQAAHDRRDLDHEHEAIMTAARQRDATGAVVALRTHLDATVQLLLETYSDREAVPAASER